MKNLKLIVITALLVCMAVCTPAFANDWSIEVDGQKLDAEVKIIDGRSLIPLRAVGEALGLKVDWYGATQEISIKDETNENTSFCWIKIPQNTYEARVSRGYNEPKYSLTIMSGDWHMHVKPVNIDGRVYVPVRLIASTFGAPVNVTGNVISVGAKYTDTGYSVKNISNLIYSENSVLEIPAEANQTATAPTQTDSATPSTATTPTQPTTTPVVKEAPSEIIISVGQNANNAYEGMELAAKALRLAIKNSTENDIKNIYKGIKNESAISTINKAKEVLDITKAYVDFAIKDCGDYSNMTEIKKYLVEMSNELTKLDNIDTNKLDFIETLNQYSRILTSCDESYYKLSEPMITLLESVKK